MEEQKEWPVPTTVEDAQFHIQQVCSGGIALMDNEWDDNALAYYLYTRNIRPNVCVTLTTSQKDFPVLSSKLIMLGAWLGDSLGTRSNLTLDLANWQDQDKMTALIYTVKKNCIHNGRLRILSTAPSGPILQVFLNDPVLAKMPWDIVVYTGQYNVIHGQDKGLPVLLDVLPKIPSGSTIFNGTWTGGRQDARLKDLSTLLTHDDWERLHERNPPLLRTMENFMKVFNVGLIAPQSLFQDQTPPEIIESAKQIWNKKKLDDYLIHCQSLRQWVKDKKKTILTSLYRNAPLADFIIALAQDKRMTKLWELKTGVLEATGSFLVTKEGEVTDTTPNYCFHLELRGQAFDTIHDIVMETFPVC